MTNVVQGAQINALLRSAKAIADAGDGDQELSILAMGLCVACQEHKIPLEAVLHHVSATYQQMESADRILLSETGKG